uniref:Uncharacterized protein n=1 Tax=Siphoviridae sp. ctv0N24 TaxID=2826509 RepID=A0A8S5N469_9CAUD|nr:MAG TPA: hypothetical protein [Siphoviridae sp. ctv0N24]
MQKSNNFLRRRSSRSPNATAGLQKIEKRGK